VARSVQRSTRAKKSGKLTCLFLTPVVAIVVATVALVATAAAPAAAMEVATDVAAVTTTVTVVAETVANAATETTTTSAPVAADVTTKVTVAAGPSVDYSAAELEFVRLLNDYRESKGLQPLMLSDVLTVACDRHSSDMATYDFVNHYTGYYRNSSGNDRALKGTRSDYFATGTDPAERMIACGYDYKTAMGENLAAGQDTAAKALKALKASATHNANLLSDDYTVIGIALVYAGGTDYGYYWTTDFGGYADATAHAAMTVIASAH
jgi:uncharacterized protein YkwD